MYPEIQQVDKFTGKAQVWIKSEANKKRKETRGCREINPGKMLRLKTAKEDVEINISWERNQ